MKRTFSKTIRTFHVWTGLIVGALFCLMSVSGSVLVLRPYIEDLLTPAWVPKSSERPAQVLTAASHNIANRWPGARIVSVVFPARSDRPLEFALITADDTELTVFSDTRSGEVLGTFALPWVQWLTDLHHHILIEGIGKKIVGFFGIFLFLSSLTGLAIWARRPNPWRLIRGRKFTSFDLHRLAGIVGNLLLLFMAATGVVNAFPQTIQQLLGGPQTASRQRPGPHAENAAPDQTSLDEYVDAARQAVPGGAIRQLRLPSKGRPVTARMSMPSDIRQEGSTGVTFDPRSVRVRAIDRPEDWPVSKKIVQASMPLHYGEWGGLSIRGLWFFIGLLPPILFVSGLIMWWTPVRARRKAARIVAARSLARDENLVA